MNPPHVMSLSLSFIDKVSPSSYMPFLWLVFILHSSTKFHLRLKEEEENSCHFHILGPFVRRRKTKLELKWDAFSAWVNICVSAERMWNRTHLVAHHFSHHSVYFFSCANVYFWSHVHDDESQNANIFFFLLPQICSRSIALVCILFKT